MSKRLHWLVWLSAVGLFVVGMWAHSISSTSTKVPIRLTPGVSIIVNEFRLFGGTGFAGSLGFENTLQLHKTAGNHSGPRSDWHKAGYIEFPNPGETIAVRVSIAGNSSSALLHAMPNRVMQGVDRSLTTSQPTQLGEARRFPWPPPLNSALTLPAGTSRIEVSVVEVGASLQGQNATLEVWPPLQFKTKSAQLGYSLLWWFYLWELQAAVLAIWAAILFALRRRL